MEEIPVALMEISFRNRVPSPCSRPTAIRCPEAMVKPERVTSSHCFAPDRVKVLYFAGLPVSGWVSGPSTTKTAQPSCGSPATFKVTSALMFFPSAICTAGVRAFPTLLIDRYPG